MSWMDALMVGVAEKAREQWLKINLFMFVQHYKLILNNYFVESCIPMLWNDLCLKPTYFF